MSVCHMLCTWSSWKRASDPLELKQQLCASRHVSAGNQMQVLYNSQVLLTSDPSLQPFVFLPQCKNNLKKTEHNMFSCLMFNDTV